MLRATSGSPPCLCSFLSHALVAYTIEADNLFESRSPHSTTLAGPVRGGGPWLVSMVMWMNCLRHLKGGPLSVADLFSAAGTGTNLDGMRRWGYIVIDTRGKRAPGRDAVLSLTKRGRSAEGVWASVVAEVDARWKERHPRYLDLRQQLEPIGRALADLPDSMPIVGYGLATRENVFPRAAPAGIDEASTVELMARLLVRIAVSFEEQAPLSLAIYADVMSALGSEPVAVRDLPRLTGVSKEAIAMAMSFLSKQGLVSLESTTRKAIRASEAGLDAIRDCRSTLDSVEQDIEREFATNDLKGVLESVCANLGEGLVPIPGGWRTAAPARLPDFPMTLHRGGYPDGA